MTPFDWIALVASALSLGGLVVAGEGLRRLGAREKATRRVVHVGVGLFVAASPALFSSPIPVYALAVTFVVVNGVSKAQHWFPGMHAARPESWGTVTFPLALVPALAVTWTVTADRIPVLQAAFLILAVADPLASWIGERTRSPVWIGKKTVAGSAAFAGAAAVVTAGMGVWGMEWAPERVAAVAVSVGVVGTAVEALGARGWDNFFVVHAVVVVLIAAGRWDVIALTGAVVVGAGFAAAAYRTRTLTARGSVAGGLLAASLVGVGGWAWTVPGFAFFVLSSALSRLQGRRDRGGDDPRTLRQVGANGGVAWTCLLAAAVLPPGAGPLGGSVPALLFAAYTGAFAAASADTWATEIGTVWGGAPRNVVTLQPVPAGTSGAASLAGTVAGVAGACCIAGLATATAVWMSGESSLGNPLTPATALVVAHPVAASAVAAGAGIAGMAADSLAGATVQARFRHPVTDALTEHRHAPSATPASGWRAVDNDAVNWICTATGAGAAAVGTVFLL